MPQLQLENVGERCPASIGVGQGCACLAGLLASKGRKPFLRRVESRNPGQIDRTGLEMIRINRRLIRVNGVDTRAADAQRSDVQVLAHTSRQLFL